LFFEPPSSLLRILVFQPAIRIRDSNAVENLCYAFNGS